MLLIPAVAISTIAYYDYKYKKAQKEKLYWDQVINEIEGELK